MKTAKYNLLFHVIGCISFFLLPLIFFPNPSHSFNVLNNPPSQRDFIGQLLLIGFFYSNYFLLIPKFYFNKKYFIFYFIVLLSLICITVIPSILTNHFHPFSNHHFNQSPPMPDSNHSHHQPPPDFNNNFNHSHQPEEPPFFGELGHTVFLFFVVFFFSLSLKINNRLKQVQQEKADAELSYLRSQINPHFLFNTLNLIYSLAIKKSEQVDEAIIKLANMMRYVLYESDKNFVPLENEIGYIKNYIDLQQTRFGASIKLDIYISDNFTAGKKIAPLILIPFVENAFKHGVNAEENSYININIQIDKSDLILNVYNNKIQSTNLINDEGGVGIKNTQNRLHLLYGSNYRLQINNNEKDFSVLLKLGLYD